MQLYYSCGDVIKKRPGASHNVRWLLLVFGLAFSAYLRAHDTQAIMFRPFTQPQALEKQTPKGQCGQQSSYIKREDAWRCQWKGQSYDPCFVKIYPKKAIALCKNTPWDRASLVFEVEQLGSSRAFASLDFSQTYPWAVELADGMRCVACEEGLVFDNLLVHYQCRDSSQLFGPIHRCKQPWSVLQKTRNQVKNSPISKAWF